MRKMKKAHLWIGLIASVLIFMESITGLLMNEPWLIGQSERGSFEGGQNLGQRGNFQPGQFNQGQNAQGTYNDDSVGNGQIQGRLEGFAGRSPGNQISFMGIVRGLHEGKIGNTNIKWLIDLTAIAMIFLTGSGIYLSIKILRAEKKRKNRQDDVLPTN